MLTFNGKKAGVVMLVMAFALVLTACMGNNGNGINDNGDETPWATYEHEDFVFNYPDPSSTVIGKNKMP